MAPSSTKFSVYTSSIDLARMLIAVIVDHLVNLFLVTPFFHGATTGSFYQHQSIRVQKVFSELVQQAAADKMLQYAMEQHNFKF